MHANAGGKGWIVSILPQLEQTALYAEFTPHFHGDFFSGGGLNSPAAHQVMQTQIPVLMCPSDGSSRELISQQYQMLGVPVAATNYKGVLGDNRIGDEVFTFHAGTLPRCLEIGGCNGLIFRVTYQEPKRFSSITDGLSNTLMVGEDVAAHNASSAAYYANGDYCACIGPINYKPNPPAPRDWGNVTTFRSNHPGGAQFCLADGSVRFVSESTEQSVYRSLCTRAGGESVMVPE
jgi:prepilin-type processing-associated H-X9-DG protein